jgi:hypothetical protein
MAGCIPFALPIVAGAPQADCNVADVSNVDSTMRTPIASCGAGVLPCWHADVSALCSTTPTQLAITIDRAGPPPPGTRPQAWCVTAG